MGKDPSVRLSPRPCPRSPLQLCRLHSRKKAAKPISAADRHAKKVLTKHVRGVRPLERAVEGRTTPKAEVVRGTWSAVRSALTDDGLPPLATVRWWGPGITRIQKFPRPQAGIPL